MPDQCRQHVLPGGNALFCSCVCGPAILQLYAGCMLHAGVLAGITDRSGGVPALVHKAHGWMVPARAQAQS